MDSPEMTPPQPSTMPLEDVYAPRSSWPTVLGVIGIVLAALGLVSVVCGVGGTLMQGVVPEEVQAPEVSGRLQVWTFVSYAATVVLGIWLLVASIKTLKRTPAGPGMLRGWSIAQLLWAIVGVVVGIVMVEDMKVLFAGQLIEAMPDVDPNLLSGFTYGIIGCGALWAMIFPIVCLLVLAKPARKAEIATW
ncbi:MAG: hypothetical protein ACR2GY_01120 [Phycisphaerales bacterium]